MAKGVVSLRSKAGEPLNRLALLLLDEMPDYINSLDKFELEGSATSFLGDGTRGVLTIYLRAARYETISSIDVEEIARILDLAEQNGFELVVEGPPEVLEALDKLISK